MFEEEADGAIELSMPIVEPDKGHSSGTKASVKVKFNPAEIIDGLSDHEVEGGIAPVMTTVGYNKFQYGASDEGGRELKEDVKDESQPIELTGFAAMIDGDSFNVLTSYDDIDTAKASISGNNYMIFYRGKPRLARIISGCPIIQDHERVIATYGSGKWGR